MFSFLIITSVSLSILRRLSRRLHQNVYIKNKFPRAKLQNYFKLQHVLSIFLDVKRRKVDFGWRRCRFVWLSGCYRTRIPSLLSGRALPAGFVHRLHDRVNLMLSSLPSLPVLARMTFPAVAVRFCTSSLGVCPLLSLFSPAVHICC